jgi:hypothetical protein
LFLRGRNSAAGGDIGEAQGEQIIALGEGAVVGNGVCFAEAWFFILPMPEGSEGDLVFEEGGGHGVIAGVLTKPVEDGGFFAFPAFR